MCTVDYASACVGTSMIHLHSIKSSLPSTSLTLIHYSRPSTTFPYCKRWKAGRGLGTDKAGTRYALTIWCNKPHTQLFMSTEVMKVTRRPETFCLTTEWPTGWYICNTTQHSTQHCISLLDTAEPRLSEPQIPGCSDYPASTAAYSI